MKVLVRYWIKDKSITVTTTGTTRGGTRPPVRRFLFDGRSESFKKWLKSPKIRVITQWTMYSIGWEDVEKDQIGQVAMRTIFEYTDDLGIE